MTNDRINMKLEAKNVLKNSGSVFYVMTFLIVLVSAASAIPVIGLLAVIADFFLAFVFVKNSLKVIKGEFVDFNTFFDFTGWKTYLKGMAWTLLYMLLYMIPLYLFAFIFGIGIAKPNTFLIIFGILGMIASYIFLFYKMFDFILVPYLACDNQEATGKELVAISREKMQGHKIEYLVLELSFILWILLGAVTCGIAYLYVMPYMQLTVSIWYNCLMKN